MTDFSFRAVETCEVSNRSALIRWAEHGKHDRSDEYNILYGNENFGNMATHPNRLVTNWSHRSTAAGAYSIVKKTYEEAVRHGVAHDFSDTLQDAIALSLMMKKGGLPFIWDGKLDAAFTMLNGTWSSLPGGSQEEITTEEGKAYFWKQLGEAEK